MSDPAPANLDLIRRYVIASPNPGPGSRYLRLLNGNFARKPGRAEFVRDLRRDAREISDDELTLLFEPNWRPRLTAAWLIGIGRRSAFRARLGELLLGSEVCFAGQGYCIALALFGTDKDADLLVEYLDRYLRRPECRYDQYWAMGSLLYLDDKTGRDRAAAFLVPGGLWDQWTNEYAPDIAKLRREVERLCGLVGAPPAEGGSVEITKLGS
ncbi:DUF6000 family protein [Actinomadura rayongensis]|uniref:Uncharacterized protein n=1 Tax=Actinomadura rayongensis TaxID=1429076 RepID=A0A6I4W898_9ACTN|nr:DUF6000 family protein [Actinomadura rayongensis]MXQ65503.1 hypothetical protein [Actinomadura rayongensis]